MIDSHIFPSILDRIHAAPWIEVLRWKRPALKDQRGYLALYRDRVTQANQGCDFDFLAPVP
jgi:hypothetical protein